MVVCLLCVMAGPVHVSCTPQMLNQFFLQGAPGLDIEALVDRFMRHVIALVTRVCLLQPACYLFWRPLQLELAGHDVGQRSIHHELTRLGTSRSTPSALIGLDCAVPFQAAVSFNFSTNR